MKFYWKNLRQWPRNPDESEQLARAQLIERNLGLPVKLGILAVLFYYFYFSNWFRDVAKPPVDSGFVPQEVPLEMVRRFFLIYVVVNVVAAGVLLGMSRLKPRVVLRTVFHMGWIDAVFVAAMSVVTGGFDSFLYWVFLGLIVRNALSTPVTSRHVTLNLIVTLLYFASGLLEVVVNDWQWELLDDTMREALSQSPEENAAEPFFLRLFLLLLMTACCAGVQILFDRQKRTEEEDREHALRQEQLQATGRLAAEIAHQLKNPLGIINNAAFTLQRTVKEGKTITQQIQIIREEVDRSDRILTELMGYARLNEGKVEKLDVAQELDTAISQVFPAGARYEVEVHRDYAPALPPLMMQRSHLSEVLVNILQNAREAMDGRGTIHVSARYGDDYSAIVTIADDGPGMPPASLAKIFEPYFTTKERGTGLGLAIVRHNTELYGGNVEVESELGQGTRFTITLPGKPLMRIRK